MLISRVITMINYFVEVINSMENRSHTCIFKYVLHYDANMYIFCNICMSIMYNFLINIYIYMYICFINNIITLKLFSFIDKDSIVGKFTQ